MSNFSYDEKMLSSLTEEEKKYALKILQELSQKGNSEEYNKLLYSDYSEIPVTISEFIHNSQYLGKALTNEEGKFTVFPYWEDVLNRIFPDAFTTNYHTAIFTGAIGLGKSTIAVICILYLLYRVLCLKNPYLYYGIQEIDTISFVFMNITLEAAGGVAWSKCQNMIKLSPWFLSHGTLSRNDDKDWKPPKGIELIVGSKNSHIIGRAVFACLDGDTIISTSSGDFPIKELVDKNIQVNTINNSGYIETSNMCTVKLTTYSSYEIQITLEDDSKIICTPEHRFMLQDGTYKYSVLLDVNDVLFSTNQDKAIKIKNVASVYLKCKKPFYDVINANPYNNFLVRTNSSYICAHNCFVDEVSFQRTMDIEKQKQYAQEIVSSASARMQSRFMKGTSDPTLLILASSKRTEQSYLETFIENKKKNDSKSTLVVDEPQWVIRTDKDSPIKFKVAIGNKFLNSEVLPLDITEEQLKLYIDRGYSIINVPMGYYENFIDDIDIALTDIAGISTSSISRYISGPRVAAIKKDYLRNPFTKDIIEVGNDSQDKVEYKDFFDMSAVDTNMMSRPLFVHLDMSLSGDKTGIAGVWIKGKKPTKDGNPSKDLYYQLAFSVSIKAPKGCQVSFEKNRNFIRWLREVGFMVKGVSSDTFQSADLQQVLSAEHFNCSIISVDRTTEKICVPYQTLRNAINEERIEMYDSKLLTEELIGLERNNNTGKIDHSPAGINSKDTADAFAGATYNAAQHAEEFAIDYGEAYESLAEVNNAPGYNDIQKQITVDFEQELNNALDPFSNSMKSLIAQKQKEEQERFRDFGMGRAMPYGNNNIANGIMVW